MRVVPLTVGCGPHAATTTLTPGDVEAKLRRTVPAGIQDGSRAAAQGLGACRKICQTSPAGESFSGNSGESVGKCVTLSAYLALDR